MRMRIAVGLVAAGLLLGPRVQSQDLLWSFERSEEMRNIELSHAGIKRVLIDGHYALQLEFDPVERPQIEFLFANGGTDWRPFGALILDVTNPSNEAIGFSIEVEDARGATTVAHTKWDLNPGDKGSYALPINSPSPAVMGMRAEPLIPGFDLMAEDRHPVDIERITKFRIFLVRPAVSHTLVIDNVRLAPGVTYGAIVDKFGQFALGEWVGKLKGTMEFGRQRKNEEAELKAHPALPGRDEYGGWASGPQLGATGYFRSAQRNGKWWLVTPSGHLFFSLGMNSVSTNEGGTVIEGRENMFQWLPASSDPLAAHYGASYQTAPIGQKIKLVQGRTFQFYTANLEQKYGLAWRARWKSTALARLRAWGFNTVGNWSDPELYEKRRVPYTVTLYLEGVIGDLSSGSDYWRRMVDPFDPSFAEAADRSAQRGTQCRDDPWCLGYFVDNELSWGNPDERHRFGLALGALSLGATSAAKQAFVAQLQKRYASIMDFNEVWNSHVAGWRQLLEEPFQPDGDFSAGMRDDMHAFVRALARRYFRTVRDALKKYDHYHLYLGSRFSSYIPESIEACAEFCDVMSFNIYQPRVEHAQWQFLDKLNKPVIVGEFHVGAVDRGMFHPGLVSTPNQLARAASFINYVRSVVDNPVFVGCHYFKYVDEPLTGRPADGENFSIGFTTVVDGLYPEMIEAAKTVSAEMYRRRGQ